MNWKFNNTDVEEKTFSLHNIIIFFSQTDQQKRSFNIIPKTKTNIFNQMLFVEKRPWLVNSIFSNNKQQFNHLKLYI